MTGGRGLQKNFCCFFLFLLLWTTQLVEEKIRSPLGIAQKVFKVHSYKAILGEILQRQLWVSRFLFNPHSLNLKIFWTPPSHFWLCPPPIPVFNNDWSLTLSDPYTLYIFFFVFLFTKWQEINFCTTGRKFWIYTTLHFLRWAIYLNPVIFYSWSSKPELYK